VPTVLKSGSLNLLEPLGPVQACNGIALPFYNTTYLHEKLNNYGGSDKAFKEGSLLYICPSRACQCVSCWQVLNTPWVNEPFRDISMPNVSPGGLTFSD